MLIPKIIIDILTFPGVVFHIFFYKFFCDIVKVGVKEVCYFQFKNPTGYVIHDTPKNFYQSFLIYLGPFILSSLFGILLYLIGIFIVKSVDNILVLSSLIFVWLGMCSLLHSFPSKNSAKRLFNATNSHIKNNFLAVIGYPFVILIYVAQFLSILWFDLIYAVSIFAFLVFLLL